MTWWVCGRCWEKVLSASRYDAKKSGEVAPEMAPRSQEMLATPALQPGSQAELTKTSTPAANNVNSIPHLPPKLCYRQQLPTNSLLPSAT